MSGRGKKISKRESTPRAVKSKSPEEKTPASRISKRKLSQDQQPEPSSPRSSKKRKLVHNSNVEPLEEDNATVSQEVGMETEVARNEEAPVSAEPSTPAPAEKPIDALSDLLPPLLSFRNVLERTIAILPRFNAKNESSQHIPDPTLRAWGRLLPQLPVVKLTGSVFTIGASPASDLVLQAAHGGSVCKLHFIRSSAFIESTSTSGILQVNHRNLRKNTKLALRSGDEISIRGPTPYSYIFELLPQHEEGDINPEESILRSAARHRALEDDTHLNGLATLDPTLESTLQDLDLILDAHVDDEDDEDDDEEGDEDDEDDDSDSGDDYLSVQLGDIARAYDAARAGPAYVPSASAASIASGAHSSFGSSRPGPNISDNELKAKLTEALQNMIINPREDPEVHSFDNFPYHISEALKRVLITVSYIFLKKPEAVNLTKDISTLNRRIMLSAPKGTQILQEHLMKALAKHYDAKVLIIDESINQLLPESRLPFSIHSLGGLESGGPFLTVDDLNLSLREPLLDDGRGPTSGSGPSRSTTFKKGDAVKVVAPRTGPQRSLTSFLKRRQSQGVVITMGGAEGRARANKDGPVEGEVGKVVLTFDDNPRKVGVAFDKKINGGVNLGGLCPEGHGYFVDTSQLSLVTDTERNPDILLVEALLEVIAKQDNQPLIVFLKDAEKILLTSYERLVQFRNHLESIEGRVILVASVQATQRDMRNDRQGFVLSKGGNSTAVLDLSFLDNLRALDDRKEPSKTNKLIPRLFPCKISVYPPTDDAMLDEWNKMVDKDVETMKIQTNTANLKRIMTSNSISYDDILTPSLLKKKVLPTRQLEKVIGWAIANELMKSGITNPPAAVAALAAESTKDSDIAKEIAQNASEGSSNKTEAMDVDTEPAAPTSEAPPKPTFTLSRQSLDFALQLYENSRRPDKKSVFDVETDNEFEKRLLSDVLAPNEIKVSFNDIGALDKVKDTLKELVMLPLKRPELFRKGNLTKPTKGILLFGPPGTGKTLLSKAVATESGANFLSISMSSIGSKWFGEGEKYARAVFSLASKISPCVIFIDEVDAILGRRDKSGEHEAMRKIKNEFMMMWDGLRTKDSERVLVLAATNRPFDLDEAVLRRMPRRLLVDLPDAENREKILKVILKSEECDSDVNLKDLANMTEGFSGSDLKSLCVAAAYQPIRELLEKEKNEESKKSEDETKSVDLAVNPSAAQSVLKEGDPRSVEEIASSPLPVVQPAEDGSTPAPSLRPLNMADFKKAKVEISASTSEDALAIAELRKWNDTYGEGGSRRKHTLSYFV